MILAAALMSGLVWYVEPARLYYHLRALKGGDLGLCLALGGLGLGVQVVKWRSLLRWVRPKTTWWESLQSLLAGFGLGLLSPGRVGELGRGVVLEGDQAAWVGLSVVDRACSAVVSLVLGWLGLAVLHPPLALALLGIGVVLGVMGYLLLPRLAGALPGQKWWMRSRAALGAGGGRGVGWVLGWSLVFNTVFLLQFFALLLSWGLPPPGTIWGVPVFFALKLLLPFSILDIGVREGAALVVFTPLGMEPAIAFNAALVQFVINVILPGVVGWALLYGHLHRRLSRRASTVGVSALSPETRRE
ncbi:MAG: flippase-like domain-containing protein [Candidatus Handelsmanbacteria bacterium]|nr:flippase-like domain-containing protein [Candidatus Handelsmanbacteria bacterium]